MSRVPFLTRDDLPTEKKQVYDQIAETRGHVARPFAALLNSPDAAGKVSAVGEQLRYLSPSIGDQVREIVTITTARVLDCQYVWTHHAESAKSSGVREEVIEAISSGVSSRRMLPKEGVFVQFTREILQENRVRDATYAAVEHLLGQQGTVDLILTVGYYAMLCMAINGLQVELEEGIVSTLVEHENSNG